MLAMVVNEDAGCLTPHGVLWFIANMLAPTEKVDASTKDSRSSSSNQIPLQLVDQQGRRR